MTDILDIETFRAYYKLQNEIKRNPDFDHELMQKSDKFINLGEILFDTMCERPLGETRNSSIDKDEVIIAFKKSENSKAAVINGIPAEFYKYSGG